MIAVRGVTERCERKDYEITASEVQKNSKKSQKIR